MTGLSDVPAACNAGVVVQFGQNFGIKVEQVSVPAPGAYTND